MHFANQAAGRIQQFNQGTYWGTLDSELYCRIFAARTSLSCELCGAPSHPATACTVTAPLPRSRPSSSCNTTVFNRLSDQLVQHLSTPVQVNVLATVLQNHPDRQLVHFLIDGFTHSFHPGMTVLPDISHICHNLQSALAEPHTVETLLAKDVKEGLMIGLFDIPPFPLFRISPIGVATRKYSGKKRLIMDLSSPHASHSKHQQHHSQSGFLHAIHNHRPCHHPHLASRTWSLAF